MYHDVHKTTIKHTTWTGLHVIEFSDPVQKQYVKMVSKTILEARPLEGGAATDWTWIVKLSDESDLEKIKTFSRVTSIEREMGQNCG